MQHSVRVWKLNCELPDIILLLYDQQWLQDNIQLAVFMSVISIACFMVLECSIFTDKQTVSSAAAFNDVIREARRSAVYSTIGECSLLQTAEQWLDNNRTGYPEVTFVR